MSFILVYVIGVGVKIRCVWIIFMIVVWFIEVFINVFSVIFFWLVWWIYIYIVINYIDISCFIFIRGVYWIFVDIVFIVFIE